MYRLSIHCLVVYLVAGLQWMTSSLVNGFADSLGDWLTDYSTSWSVGESVGWLISWLVGFAYERPQPSREWSSRPSPPLRNPLNTRKSRTQVTQRRQFEWNLRFPNLLRLLKRKPSALCGLFNQRPRIIYHRLLNASDVNICNMSNA